MLSLSFESPVALFSTTCYFLHEFIQQRVTSPVVSRENQAYSAVTGAMG